MWCTRSCGKASRPLAQCAAHRRTSTRPSLPSPKVLAKRDHALSCALDSRHAKRRTIFAHPAHLNICSQLRAFNL
eukprot:3041933-Pleurochrysis_carterae.AAC.1